MSSLIENARLFATAAHGAIDQRRKYILTPYIEHPAAVADMVRQAGGDEPMIAAAWLHDVVEDTAITLATLHMEFGHDVATLVDWLSDLQTPEDGNRATRKARAAERLGRAPGRAQTIKYADLIHNTQSIVAYDPKFARTYLEEKRQMLEAMHKGEAALRRQAWEVLRTSLATLG